MARILICDNEEPLRALVRATLQIDGHELFEACDGDQALDRLRALRPDLIVLDMMMPGRTGIEILGEIRADAHLAGTKVIMLTARTQESDRKAAERAGADRFLRKPFSPLELAKTVDELLAGR
jgi:two-component system, OmpR family, phosphate regulon response regulator PhoB